MAEPVQSYDRGKGFGFVVQDLGRVCGLGFRVMSR